MKSVLKVSLWLTVAAVVAGGLAMPKVLPMLQASNDNQATASPRRNASAPLKVTTHVVEAGAFAETLMATGTLRAEEGVELQAETNGKIVAINFVEGARVKKGDLLVKLNDADLRATRERAVHRRDLAMLRESRFRTLIKDGIARQEDYDNALSEVNVQNAEIALVEAQIAKTEIRAPFDGVVGLRYVSEGSFVNAASRLATLQRLDTIKVDFSVPEKYASLIRVGNPIHFSVVGSEERFRGEIYAYDPRIDDATRSVMIRAISSNADTRLLPGAFANVEMTLSQVNNAIFVPAVAVVPGFSDKNVFILQDGVVARRQVETGTRTDTSVQIMTGLSAGDVVITSGLQQLRPGLAVVTDVPASGGARSPGPRHDQQPPVGVAATESRAGEATPL